MNFIKSIFEIITQAISLAPIEVLVVLGVSLLILIVVFRKKIKKIPMLIFILFFALLASHIPGMMLQYQQALGGCVVGMKKDIMLFEADTRRNGRDNAYPIQLIEEQKKEYQEILVKYQTSSGFKKYVIFFTNTDKMLYESVLENYATVLVFNKEGWMALLFGGAFGLLLWKLIAWGFSALFSKKKGGN